MHLKTSYSLVDSVDIGSETSLIIIESKDPLSFIRTISTGKRVVINASLETARMVHILISHLYFVGACRKMAKEMCGRGVYDQNQ